MRQGDRGEGRAQVGVVLLHQHPVRVGEAPVGALARDQQAADSRPPGRGGRLAVAPQRRSRLGPDGQVVGAQGLGPRLVAAGRDPRRRREVGVQRQPPRGGLDPRVAPRRAEGQQGQQPVGGRGGVRPVVPPAARGLRQPPLVDPQHHRREVEPAIERDLAPRRGRLAVRRLRTAIVGVALHQPQEVRRARAHRAGHAARGAQRLEHMPRVGQVDVPGVPGLALGAEAPAPIGRRRPGEAARLAELGLDQGAPHAVDPLPVAGTARPRQAPQGQGRGVRGVLQERRLGPPQPAPRVDPLPQEAQRPLHAAGRARTHGEGDVEQGQEHERGHGLARPEQPGRGVPAAVAALLRPEVGRRAPQRGGAVVRRRPRARRGPLFAPGRRAPGGEQREQREHEPRSPAPEGHRAPTDPRGGRRPAGRSRPAAPRRARRSGTGRRPPCRTRGW